MKYDPQLYRAEAHLGQETLHQLVLVYNLDVARTIVGMEFFGQVWSGPAFPQVGQTHFAQQLVQFAYAAHAYTASRANDAAEIDAKLKETYGAALQIQVATVP